MHELGIMYHVVKTVQEHVRINNVTKVYKIVLEIGEMTAVVPKYIYDCYPAAIDGTELEETELEIQTVQAIGQCRQCGTKFPIVEHRGYCSHCKVRDYDTLSGKQFNIKEIHAK